MAISSGRKCRSVCVIMSKRIALALGPLNEMAVVLSPAGGGVVIAEAVGIGPFLDWIARRRERAGRRRNRNARRAFRQPDRSPRPWPLQAENRRELVLVGPVDADVVTGAAPSRCRRSRSRSAGSSECVREAPRASAGRRRNDVARTGCRPDVRSSRRRERSPRKFRAEWSIRGPRANRSLALVSVFRRRGEMPGKACRRDEPARAWRHRDKSGATSSAPSRCREK